MSRFSKITAAFAAVLSLAACSRTAKINMEVDGLASSEVIVKLLDVNKFDVLDTIALNTAGKCAYKVDVQKGQPEFVYVFYGDVKIASMILSAGDKVSVKADTLGNYVVEGSEESIKLAQVEKDYAAALSKMSSLASELENATDAAEAIRLRQALGQEYVSYYRSRVKYVMENSSSLSVVPVF